MATPHKQLGTRERPEREAAKRARIQAFQGLNAGLEPLPVEPPECLAGAAGDMWAELYPMLPRDLVRLCDAPLVAQLCRLVGKLNAGGITPGENSALLACLDKLGMTPAARRKLAALKPAGPDDAAARFSRFM